MTGSRIGFGVAVVAFSGLLAIASADPRPRLWGVHMLGFVSEPMRTVLWLALLAALGLVLTGIVMGVARGGTLSPGDQPCHARTPPPWGLPAFVAVSGAMFYVLRARTQFLGDGALWLTGLQEGEFLETSEPLAAALWLGIAGALRAAHAEITAEAVAPFSIACGMAAAAVTWLLAVELARGREHFIPTLVLLTTIGSTVLFFGYIESYPPVAVAILTFLYAGVRSVRRGSSPIPAGLVLAAAIASHLACAYLIPAYAFAAVRAGKSFRSASRHIGLALGTAVCFLLLLGFGPDRIGTTLRIAALAIAPVGVESAMPRGERPYPLISWDHALDLGNELLLVVPVSLVLIGARLGSVRSAFRERRDPTGTFLAISAASGAAVATVLVLPVAPAQDWDLFALFLIPMGILGVYFGQELFRGRGGALIACGTQLLGATTLVSFVLVNASASSGLRRFENLAREDARMTHFARVYAYEILAHYHRHRGDPARAVAYAERLLNYEPTNPRLWAMVGTIRFAQGDYARAIPFLEEAIARGRHAAGTWNNLGICYANTGRYADAVAQFRSAVASEPHRPDYRLNLALGLISLGRSGEARDVLLEIARRWPGYAPARKALQKYFRGPR